MKERKSKIYTDKKGYTYYQTMSFEDTYGNKKKRIPVCFSMGIYG